jgi:hypothetical protein
MTNTIGVTSYKKEGLAKGELHSPRIRWPGADALQASCCFPAVREANGQPGPEEAALCFSFSCLSPVGLSQLHAVIDLSLLRQSLDKAGASYILIPGDQLRETKVAIPFSSLSQISREKKFK